MHLKCVLILIELTIIPSKVADFFKNGTDFDMPSAAILKEKDVTHDTIARRMKARIMVMVLCLLCYAYAILFEAGDSAIAWTVTVLMLRHGNNGVMLVN